MDMGRALQVHRVPSHENNFIQPWPHTDFRIISSTPHKTISALVACFDGLHQFANLLIINIDDLYVN